MSMLPGKERAMHKHERFEWLPPRSFSPAQKTAS
jgi:hypothetical protein